MSTITAKKYAEEIATLVEKPHEEGAIMDQYRVVKAIVKGFSMRNPQKYSTKVIAKAGTILTAEPDYSRIGAVTVLRTAGDRYVCDLGSFTANEHCVKSE